MSQPMTNVYQGGYAPPGFVAGYPNAPPPELHPGYGPPPPLAPYGFVSGQPAGYIPVPQMPQYGEAPPIINQPPQPMGGTGESMSIPVGIPNCPSELAYLTTVSQLLVKQKVELLEAFTGFETKNKFEIKNALGQTVFYAAEDSDCCSRNLCGPARPFDMKIFNNFQHEVIHMNRPLACQSCCFPCCLQTMEVSSPPGNVIGSIEQEWTLITPAFRIKNHLGDTVLRVEGPCFTFSCCGDVEFDILSLTGEKIGKISKQWSGFAREVFSDADFFGITFPLDLDVKIKAVLLGATFLIDAMFFEKTGNR